MRRVLVWIRDKSLSAAIKLSMLFVVASMVMLFISIHWSLGKPTGIKVTKYRSGRYDIAAEFELPVLYSYNKTVADSVDSIKADKIVRELTKKPLKQFIDSSIITKYYWI